MAGDERPELADFLATPHSRAVGRTHAVRVRHVVAHIFSYKDLGLLALVR